MSEEEGTKGTIEEAFSAIEEGNTLAKQSYFWEALESFFEAHKILKQLAADDAEDGNKKDEKLRALFKQQASEYFFKARKTLLQALQFESDKDKDAPVDPVDGEPKYCVDSLNDDEAQQRILLFASLFAREEDVWRLMAENDEEKTSSAGVGEQQSSLEERLMSLNQSLPSGFKTSDERMRDINRGLNRLGLSLHSNTDTPKTSRLDMPSKSETEQVDDIIAQAKDEVAMNNSHPSSGATDAMPSQAVSGPSTQDVFLDDAGDSDLSEKDSDDDDDDEELLKEDLEIIREKVNAAQASLAQLNALLAATEDDENDVKFDQNSGKKALRDARVLLQEATRRWRDKTEE